MRSVTLEDRVAGTTHGVNTYLAKPFSSRELLSAARGLVKMQAATADILLHAADGLPRDHPPAASRTEINNPLNYVKNALARVRMDAQALLEKKEMSAEELQKLDKRVRDLFQVAESGLKRIAGTVS